MIIRGYEIATRTIGYIIAAVVVTVLALLLLSQCEKRRNQGAQSRVDAAQGQARDESGADAVNTVARSGEAAAASEELTRSNEKEIRNAQGADERVGAGVNAAGLRSLCRRASYSNNPRCRMFKPAPR